MIGLLLASHGELCKGIENSLNLVMGEQENVITLPLYSDSNIDEYSMELERKIDELNDGDGVIVMVDLLGGSPCNRVSRLVQSKKIKVLTGMNLPMVFSFVEARLQGMNLDDAAAHCLKFSKEGIYDLASFINVNQ